jgi:hypothetical protein
VQIGHRGRRTDTGLGVVTDREEAGPVGEGLRVEVLTDRYAQGGVAGGDEIRGQRVLLVGRDRLDVDSQPVAPAASQSAKSSAGGRKLIIVLCDEQPPRTLARECRMCELPCGWGTVG